MARKKPKPTRPGSLKPKPTPVEVLQPAGLKPPRGKPGPSPPKPTPARTLNTVVAAVNAIYVRGALETALEVAQTVVDQLLGGDARRLSRGESDPALKSLAEHEGLRVPPHTLWTALAVYEQVQLMPEELVPQLPLSHHRILLGVPKPKAKLNLARRAVREDLSQDQIQVAVTRWRARHKLPQLGRPPLDPAITAARRMSTAALRLEQAIEEKLPTGDPRKEVLRKVALTRKRLGRIEKELNLTG